MEWLGGLQGNENAPYLSFLPKQESSFPSAIFLDSRLHRNDTGDHF